VKYLGVTLSNNMSWAKHINKITAKANKILSFLRRNLQIKQEETKSIAYKSMVRSNLVYCSSIWVPHTKQHIDKIERVQRRAARYVTKRYHNTSSVTSMLNHLNWNTLENRRNINRVSMLYKITHNLVAIDPNLYLVDLTMDLYVRLLVSSCLICKFLRKKLTEDLISFCSNVIDVCFP
jgi:hypothetical protein